MTTQSLVAWSLPITPSLRRAALDLAGAGVVAVCLEAGVAVQKALAIPVPGSVVGMVLLLALLWTGAVPEQWLTRVSSWLRLLLPALFVPLYAVPLASPGFWTDFGARFLPAAVAGAAIMLTVAGWLAGRMVRS
ncbi:MAG: CidA/LrgA family protein [Acetobacteraceae bacterium]|jgi:holin-like protein